MNADRFVPDQQGLALADVTSRAVAQRWVARPAYRRLTKAFADAELASAEQIADQAERLFATPDWLEELLEPLVAALREGPWFQPPFRVSRGTDRIGAVLFQSPAVTITASVVAPGERPASPHKGSVVVVSGRLAVTCCHRSGGARWARFEAGAADDQFSASKAAPCLPMGSTTLSDGGIYREDGRTGGHLTLGGAGHLVMVTAIIARQSARVVRDYCAVTGRLLRLVSLDDGAARAQMLLAFLAQAARPEAPALMAALSSDPAFFVRWSAMQQWLTTDVRGAFPRLSQMADNDAHPEIRAAAAAMLKVAEAHLACRA
ncbi:MAG: hypothetical protein ACKVOB_13875 [Sphingomonas sp.]